jgi:hypothetical protein
MDHLRSAIGTATWEGTNYDEALPSELPAVPKILLTFPPKVVTAPMQTTMMSASMIAYSTAVGPSSIWMKRTIHERNGASMAKPPMIQEVTEARQHTK